MTSEWAFGFFSVVSFWVLGFTFWWWGFFVVVVIV